MQVKIQPQQYKLIIMFGIIIFSVLLIDGCNKLMATDTVIVKQRVVQFDPNTFLGTNGYYAHGENLRSQRQTQDDATLEALKEQNKILRELVAAVLAGKGNTGNIDKLDKPEKPEKPEKPVDPPLPPDNSTLIEKEVLKIFKDNCVKCHGETKADGGLSLVKNDKLVDIPLGKMILVHHRTNGVNLNGDVKMPKGNNGLSDEQVELLRMWLVEKALNQE